MNIVPDDYMAKQETTIGDMETEINRLNEFISNTHKDIVDLYMFVDMQDIPNPTIPEYAELHEKILSIRGVISKIIRKIEQEVSHGR